VNQTSIEQHKLSLYYRTIPSGTTIDEAHTRPARRNAKPTFSLTHSDSSHVIPSPHGLSAAAFARRGLFWWRAQLTEFLFRPRTHLLAPPAPRAHVHAPPHTAPPRTAVKCFCRRGARRAPPHDAVRLLLALFLLLDCCACRVSVGSCCMRQVSDLDSVTAAGVCARPPRQHR